MPKLYYTRQWAHYNIGSLKIITASDLVNIRSF